MLFMPSDFSNTSTDVIGFWSTHVKNGSINLVISTVITRTLILINIIYLLVESQIEKKFMSKDNEYRFFKKKEI